MLYFVAENTIEHRMLDVLRMKSELADEVVDGAGRSAVMKLPSGRRAFMERVESLVGDEGSSKERVTPGRPADLPPHITGIDDMRTVKGRLVARTNKSAVGPPLNRYSPPAPVTTEPLVLDPEICAAIRILAADGGLTIADPELAALIGTVSPHVDENEIRRVKVKEHLGISERRLSAAELLKEAGFVEEALAPVADALESALAAGASNLDGPVEPQIPISKVQMVAEKYHLGNQCLVLTARLRHERESLETEVIPALLDHAQQMTRRLHIALGESA